MGSTLSNRIKMIESRINPKNDRPWIRLIDFGDHATEPQQQVLKQGLAKAEADGLNVILRTIIDSQRALNESCVANAAG